MRKILNSGSKIHNDKAIYASGDLGEDDTADETMISDENQCENHSSRSAHHSNCATNNGLTVQTVSHRGIVNELAREKHSQKSKNPAPRRKPSDPVSRETRFLKDVLRLQMKTDLIIPRLPFSRLVREIIQALSTDVNRITASALEALQTSSEYYVTQRLQDAYLLSLHRGRSTLTMRDMKLINYLRNTNNG